MRKLLVGLLAFSALFYLWADTTTPRLGLIIPTVGSPSWGQKVNYNFSVLDSTVNTNGSGSGGQFLVSPSSGLLPGILANNVQVSSAGANIFQAGISAAPGITLTNTGAGVRIGSTAGGLVSPSTGILAGILASNVQASSVAATAFQTALSAGSNITLTNTGAGVRIGSTAGGTVLSVTGGNGIQTGGTSIAPILTLDPAATSFIQARATLQSGATFYASSGTATNFNTTTLKFADGTAQATAGGDVFKAATQTFTGADTFTGAVAMSSLTVNTTSFFAKQFNFTPDTRAKMRLNTSGVIEFDVPKFGGSGTWTDAFGLTAINGDRAYAALDGDLATWDVAARGQAGSTNQTQVGNLQLSDQGSGTDLFFRNKFGQPNRRVVIMDFNISTITATGYLKFTSSGGDTTEGDVTLETPPGITPNATYYIQNSSTLQSGATFYISSGTVQTNLNVNGSFYIRSTDEFPVHFTQTNPFGVSPGIAFYKTSLFGGDQLLGTVGFGGNTGYLTFKDTGGSLRAAMGGANGASGVVVYATGTVQFQDADNSNYVEFKASNTVASNVTFTLPAADGSAGQFMKTDGVGNLSFGAASGGGKVLQVVVSSESIADNTTSTSFTATSLLCKITPSTTTSKILVSIQASVSQQGVGVHIGTIYRNGSNLFGTEGCYYANNPSTTWYPLGQTIWDAPASTSTLTYQVYFRTAAGGTIQFGTGTAGVTTMILTEVAP